ncbi:hypothetical protein V5799_011759 [Amblyomma americanum]|uniref:Uncharacterized protein n=1 Tax=Amblyomma americanum TaxID=6943 RepID=A0AAQ4EFZ8_AMBAM
MLLERHWMQQDSDERPQERNRRDTAPDALEGWPPEDTSYSGRSVRYTSFVLSMSLTMTSTLLVTPTILFMQHVGTCHRGCFSMDDDLRLSINRSVHPCDDFYG